jgi:hypothetical protein
MKPTVNGCGGGRPALRRPRTAAATLATIFALCAPELLDAAPPVKQAQFECPGFRSAYMLLTLAPVLLGSANLNGARD